MTQMRLLFLELDFPRLAILHQHSPYAIPTHELPWVSADFLIAHVNDNHTLSLHPSSQSHWMTPVPS